MRKNFFSKIENTSKGTLTNEGYLKCQAAVMRSDNLTYLAEEMPELQDIGVEEALIYVPPEELKDPASLATLEGVGVIMDDHDWQFAGKNDGKMEVGSVVGTPSVVQLPDDDGRGDYYVYVDMLIKDPKAINMLQNDTNYGEISAAYLAEVDLTPGVTPRGDNYAGTQRSIKYNHVLLLPRGEGRGGETLRVLNKLNLEGKNMSTTYASVRVNNRLVRVCNEDADALRDEIGTMEEKVKNQAEGSNLEEAIKNVDLLNQQIGDQTSIIEDLQAQLQESQSTLKQYKDEIESKLNPEAIADQADSMMEEQDDADSILNAYDASDDKDKKDAVDNSGKRINRKYGHTLRLYVVNKVRQARKQGSLDDDTAKNEAVVKGMFTGLGMALDKAHTKPTGYQVFNNMTDQHDIVRDDKKNYIQNRFFKSKGGAK